MHTLYKVIDIQCMCYCQGKGIQAIRFILGYDLQISQTISANNRVSFMGN